MLLYLARYNLLIDLYGLISEERRIACCHLIDKYSQCPPINCFVVSLQNKIINSLAILTNCQSHGQTKSSNADE